MDSPQVLVITSDQYLHALRSFAWLLNHHWMPQPRVVVGGFTSPDFPLPSNFEFHSIGKFEDYPVQRWSDALIKFLNERAEAVFVLMLEDYWVTRRVDALAVKMLYDYMRQFRYVCRLDLTRDREMSGFAHDYDKCGHLDLIQSDPNSQYHMSLMAALWRKEHLLKIVVPGETPWQLEINGTPRLAALKDQVIVLGTKNQPLIHTLALRGGKPDEWLLDDLQPEDREELERQGLLPERVK